MKNAAAVLVMLGLTAWAHVGIHDARDAAAENAPPDVRLDVNIPADIGGFRQSGSDIDVGDDIREVLQTSTILMRRYISPQKLPILLTIVHAGATKRSLHHPEVCLVGQGWEIREQSTGPVGFQFDAKRLVLFHGSDEEAVLYWLKTGDRFTSSAFMNAWYWALGQLFFDAPASTMIKLSAPVTQRGADATFRVLEDFAGLLAPIVLEEIR